MNPEYLPMNAAALMDRVFDLYKATFKTQIAFSLIIGIVSFILMILLGIMLAFAVGVAMGVTGYMDERYILMMAAVVLIGVLPLYMGWIYLSASGHILITKQAFYGEPIEFPFRDAVGAFLRVITAAIAQLVMALPFLALLAYLVYSAVAGHDDIIYLIMNIHPAILIFGGLAFTIFYVIYSNIFALSIPAAIFERRVFFATVSRSFVLLKGDFWKILGLRLLWALLIFLFSYSAQGLLMFLVAALAAFAGNIMDFGTLWVTTGPLQFYASLFVSILVGPMEGIMTALIYFNQKIKKDGLDIEIGIFRLARGAAL